MRRAVPLNFLQSCSGRQAAAAAAAARRTAVSDATRRRAPCSSLHTAQQAAAARCTGAPGAGGRSRCARRAHSGCSGSHAPGPPSASESRSRRRHPSHKPAVSQAPAALAAKCPNRSSSESRTEAGGRLAALTRIDCWAGRRAAARVSAPRQRARDRTPRAGAAAAALEAPRRPSGSTKG